MCLQSASKGRDQAVIKSTNFISAIEIRPRATLNVSTALLAKIAFIYECLHCIFLHCLVGLLYFLSGSVCGNEVVFLHKGNIQISLRYTLRDILKVKNDG